MKALFLASLLSEAPYKPDELFGDSLERNVPDFLRIELLDHECADSRKIARDHVRKDLVSYPHSLEKSVGSVA